MFKVGDIVKIKEEYIDRYWYSDKLFTIKEIKYYPSNEIVLILDRDFYEQHDKIKIEGVYLAVKEIRKQKLQKICSK